MSCCEISDCAQMSKTIIAVRHFGLGGRESLERGNVNYKIEVKIQFLYPSLTDLIVLKIMK